MKEKYYKVLPDDKEDMISRIDRFLRQNPDVLFAYVHGSFVTEDRFRDIDAAIYLKPPPEDPLQMELDLETLFSRQFGYPVDVRILNSAPVSFCFNVIRCGRRIAVIDDDARCDFEEKTCSVYYDFAPYRDMYLKEALGGGI